MDKNWFDNLIDDKGNWIVPESGVKNLKEVAPKLYGEVLEEIRIRGAVASSTTETKQCLQDSEVLGGRKVVLSEGEIEPCCGRPSCDGCKLIMEDEAWEKLKALGVDEYNKLIEKHGTPWDNGNKKLSLEPTTKEVKDDILNYMASKGCFPKYNSINGEDKPFSRVKGDAPVMAKRDPKDYPENCECGKCGFADVCNISCDCTVEGGKVEDNKSLQLPADWTLETEEDRKLCQPMMQSEDIAWDVVASRMGMPDIEKMTEMVDKEIEREEKKTSGFNELTKAVRAIIFCGKENDKICAELCVIYREYCKQFRYEAKQLIKSYNGFIDRDVFIHALSSKLYAKFKDEVIWMYEKKYPLFDEMYTVRDITKEVLDDLCEDEVLSWRNVLMTRKAYTRFVRMFSEFYSQRMSEKLFGTPLDIGCTFPRSWNKF